MFSSLVPKIQSFLTSDMSALNIIGASSEQWGVVHYFLQKSLKKDDALINNHVFITKDIEEAERIFSLTQSIYEDHSIHLLPGNESSPYSGPIGFDENLIERFKVYNDLIDNPQKNIIILTYESLRLKCPPQSFFTEYHLTIGTSDIIPPEELAKKLINLGYSNNTSAEEIATFSRRGEIFDIYTISSGAIRIHYFDDMIEEIKKIDPSTQMTIKESQIERIKISPAPQIFCQSIFSNELRNKIPQPQPTHKNKFLKRKTILEDLKEGIFRQNQTLLAPLFFNQAETIFDYLSGNVLTHLIESSEIQRNNEQWDAQLEEEFLDISNDTENNCVFPAPENFYFSLDDIIDNKKVINTSSYTSEFILEKSFEDSIHLQLEPINSFISKSVDHFIQKKDLFKVFPEVFEKYFSKKEIPCYYFYTNENSKNKFQHQIPHKNIKYIKAPLTGGFFAETDNILLLSDADFFSYRRVQKQTENIQEDLFAEQLSSLTIGDYLMHSVHGIGKYTGMKSMDAGNIKSDFLIIEFKDNDKIYLPVYKLNLIQKHAGSEQSINVASLRNNSFNKAKEKARSSVKKLAFDLIKLQAERDSANAFAFSPPDDNYQEFELSFPYQETGDQTTAINNVVNDMQKPKPMDHLVCGDVGFGKTEVAMRAAFKAVIDHKQVGVLVPTTILALQHYHSFKNRFKNFPVNIDYLSRFRSTKEAKEVLQKLEKGEIDIVIGTHKLLSDQVKFNDLGLLIVDEEHKFGVTHKEKIKRYKSSIDILTLTATPIPRTMQIAYMGLRSLSLIKTPPPKRQSIKSYLIQKDPLTLKKAIDFELKRGGQIYIVHNRVNDIELFAAEIRELVPNAKIVIAHGQLPEKDLERRVNLFFSGEYQILISTVIIESGLDVPNANTMIVNNSDNYGLAQLHQLRGRIGRSDRKAYAYFVIPKNKKLTDIAQKRLKALITYADLGSGFNIASSDLEIRGAGNIIGPEQSGHIENIGLELYTQLLNEAINELKGIKTTKSKNVEVSVPFSAYIPNNYIEHTATRLKYYKKLSNSKKIEEIEACEYEFEDIYGHKPVELENLILTLKCRYYLENCGVSSLSATNTTITIQFDQDIFKDNPDLSTKVFDIFVRKAQKRYKFSPDNSVLYDHQKTLELNDVLEFCLDTYKKICTD